jgi:hypothetical protein
VPATHVHSKVVSNSSEATYGCSGMNGEMDAVAARLQYLTLRTTRATKQISAPSKNLLG